MIIEIFKKDFNDDITKLKNNLSNIANEIFSNFEGVKDIKDDYDVTSISFSDYLVMVNNRLRINIDCVDLIESFFCDLDSEANEETEKIPPAYEYINQIYSNLVHINYHLIRIYRTLTGVNLFDEKEGKTEDVIETIQTRLNDLGQLLSDSIDVSCKIINFFLGESEPVTSE